jgi:hypothetical protein
MTITQRVVKDLRDWGIPVYTRWNWRTTVPHTYQWRRVFRRHKLIPKQPVDTIWQHITVTKSTGTTPESFKADMRTLEKIGNDRFGSGVSYNFVVDMQTGEVGIGQSLDAAGTHTLNDKNVKTPGGQNLSYNQNYVSLAIACLGMPGAQLSNKAKASIVAILRALQKEKALTKSFDYLPHSWVAPKDCPTDNVRNAMHEIQSRV